MQPRHAAAALTLLTALTAGLAGCGGDDDPQAQPTPSPSPATSEPSPTDPAGGPPAGWEDEFTAAQLNTYNAALMRWEQYRKLSNEIYRKGKNTPEARDTLREFNLFWQRDIVTLARDYDQGGIREEVPPEPLWSYARSVKPGYVEIIQCTDFTDVRVTKNGDVLDNKPKHPVTPLVIEMTKPKGGDWMWQGSTLEDKKSCAAA